MFDNPFQAPPFSAQSARKVKLTLAVQEIKARALVSGERQKVVWWGVGNLPGMSEPSVSSITIYQLRIVLSGVSPPFLREMERGENANGQKFGQVRVPSRRLNFRQDLPELQDQLI